MTDINNVTLGFPFEVILTEGALRIVRSAEAGTDNNVETDMRYRKLSIGVHCNLTGARLVIQS